MCACFVYMIGSFFSSSLLPRQINVYMPSVSADTRTWMLDYRRYLFAFITVLIHLSDIFLTSGMTRKCWLGVKEGLREKPINWHVQSTRRPCRRNLNRRTCMWQLALEESYRWPSLFWDVVQVHSLSPSSNMLNVVIDRITWQNQKRGWHAYYPRSCSNIISKKNSPCSRHAEQRSEDRQIDIHLYRDPCETFTVLQWLD